MFHPRMANLMSLLLAIILLAATVTPPAVRHTHSLVEGGTVHHRHDANRYVSDEHEHHGDECELHLAGRNVSDAAMVGGNWWHRHFHLLGLEFTLPEPVSDQGDRECDGRDTFSVLASAQELFLCLALRSASAQQVLTPSTLSSPGDAAPMQVVVSAPAPVSHTPLCDRVRRERSGVLTV